jgi:hypothetical protein
MVGYRDSLTLLYADAVRTSQETCLHDLLRGDFAWDPEEKSNFGDIGVCGESHSNELSGCTKGGKFLH